MAKCPFWFLKLTEDFKKKVVDYLKIWVRWQNEKNITAVGLDCKARGGRTQ